MLPGQSWRSNQRERRCGRTDAAAGRTVRRRPSSEVCESSSDVALPLAQGRQHELHQLQPEQQVGAEAALCHQSSRSRLLADDHADVGACFAAGCRAGGTR